MFSNVYKFLLGVNAMPPVYINLFPTFFGLFPFLIKNFVLYGFATFEISMGETSMPRNFTLSKGFVKQAVEQFTV